MSHHDALLKDFLKAQIQSPAPAAKRRIAKTSNVIMNPAQHGAKQEVDLDYIIEKKPKAKKVLKFLQDEIDTIMAEAEA